MVEQGTFTIFIDPGQKCLSATMILTCYDNEAVASINLEVKIVIVVINFNSNGRNKVH